MYGVVVAFNTMNVPWCFCIQQNREKVLSHSSEWEFRKWATASYIGFEMTLAQRVGSNVNQANSIWWIAEFGGRHKGVCFSIIIYYTNGKKLQRSRNQLLLLFPRGLVLVRCTQYIRMYIWTWNTQFDKWSSSPYHNEKCFPHWLARVVHVANQ